jgi:hypothetical protein
MKFAFTVKTYLTILDRVVSQLWREAEKELGIRFRKMHRVGGDTAFCPNTATTKNPDERVRELAACC